MAKSDDIARRFLLLNLGHALNHYLILVFPTAALFLVSEWDMSYADLLKLGSAGALAYGAGAIPAGWLADRYGRETMMAVFFLGIGVSSVIAGLAAGPWSITISITLLGLFAAIYHPVGIAMVYELSARPGRLLAINGVAGNLGLALAAVSTTSLAQWFGWRAAFLAPGLLTLGLGVYYATLTRAPVAAPAAAATGSSGGGSYRYMPLIFISIVTIALCGGLVFNSLTTALPKILAVDMGEASQSLASAGGKATLMLALASLAQIIMGELLERYRAEWLLAGLTSMQVAVLAMAALSDSPTILLALALFVTFGQIPANDLLVGKYSSTQWRSRFYAMKYTLGLGVASIAYWLIALSFESTGAFDLLYSVLALTMAVAAGAALMLAYVSRPILQHN